jgi:hypothetical protein
VRFYARKRHIGWKWQSLDSKSRPAPLGGTETGKNPTDRAKLGSKVHILVDQRGAPLAAHITGANQHDKWSACNGSASNEESPCFAKRLPVPVSVGRMAENRAADAPIL